MGWLKNASPFWLTFYASTALGVISAAVLYLLEIPLKHSLILLMVIIIASFVVINYLLNKLIYDKIKLLYQSIRTTKHNRGESGNLIKFSKENPLANIEKEVSEWAEGYQRELDESNKRESYRKEFLGNVAHELKTPITNIQGHIWTLLDGALYDEKVNEAFLLKAAKNTDRLQYLVEELLSINQLEQGRWNISKSKYNIKKQIKSVIATLEDKATKRKISILFDEDSKKHEVLADENLINQVLTNLIVNAINYSDEGSYVKISYRNLDKKLLISVEDNGIGISEADLPRLFERFYRVDQSRSRASGGTGLGLAIVKHILDAHEQDINVNSTIGEGTNFTFTLDLS